MLRNASEINGYAVAAADGRLGSVSDLLFDDATWLVRWLVVDTSKWLFGRKVLLPPSVLGHLDPKTHEFSVRLTMQQVKDSPGIATDQPVSRQMETSVYDHYGWSPYWNSGFYMGGYGLMGGFGFSDGEAARSSSVSSQQREEDELLRRRSDADVHLRSVDAVTGYHIAASDGEIGHVEDFLVEDADWSIHYLVVDTKNWWPGTKVLISPKSAQEIDWTRKKVHLNVDRKRVKGSPAYNASMAVDRAYEKQFHSHYDDAQSAAHR